MASIQRPTISTDEGMQRRRIKRRVVNGLKDVTDAAGLAADASAVVRPYYVTCLFRFYLTFVIM